MLPIIIDTDPWVDDALAIMFAIQKNMPILWFTTVYGNNSVENSTKNALTILSVINKDIPVYEWANSPLVGNGILASCQWKNGLWWFETIIKYKKQKENALNFLIQTLEKQKVDIVCLGPLTNIAILGIMRPDLIKNINRLIILWWVFYQEWNKSPLAEFNVINDPYSFEKVFSYNVEKVLVPADVCRKVIFQKEDFVSSKNSKEIQSIVDWYISYYQDIEWFSGGVMYDVLATIYLSNSELFKSQEKYVDVEYNEWKCFGQTFIDKIKKWNCRLVYDVDNEKIKNIFIKGLLHINNT